MASGDRLARVHRLRVVLRRQAQDAVSRVRGALAALAEETASARTSQDATRALEETAARGGGLPGADLRQLRAYEAVARAREERLLADAARLQERLAACRETVLARRREERQLERLIDRARAEREASEERTVAALLDDLARRRRR
jgi:flagellar export protein FliJ